MNYIILDLEWDSAYSVRHKRFINQILQIGAVKLDEKLNMIDSFEVTIRSILSKKVTGRFARMTGITTEKMQAGIPFKAAVEQYNSWCGEDTVTMTWSTSDLFTILENEKLLLDGVHFSLEKYIDLQNFVQNEMRLSGKECTSQISLADAAEVFDISTDELELHTAKDDSLVCVSLLKKNYVKERFEALIKDTRDPEFYKRLCFKPYYLNDLFDPLVDRKELYFVCEECGQKMKRTSKWKYRNRWFCADFFCKDCDKTFNCRISFKKNYDNVIVKKKILEPRLETDDKNEVQPVSAQV